MRVLDKGQERVAQQPRSVGWSTVGGKVTSRLASGVPSVGVRFAASAGPQDQSREPGKQHGDALTRVLCRTRPESKWSMEMWRGGPESPGGSGTRCFGWSISGICLECSRGRWSWALAGSM